MPWHVLTYVQISWSVLPSKQMGKLWYFSFSKGSVFVQYVNGTEFVEQQRKSLFSTLNFYDAMKSMKHS